jgi:ornithine decarboxylase
MAPVQGQVGAEAMMKETTGMNKIDTNIPSTCEFHFDKLSSRLPHPYLALPASVTCLSECAQWHIDMLEKEFEDQDEAEEPQSGTTSINNHDVEDALDDGFVLCDLQVIQQKLLAWRHLFPRIKPFFALKCNPDPMVAAVLGRTNQAAGFDCASLSEISLALTSCTNSSALSLSVSSPSSAAADLIVYANPQRAERDLEASLELGVSAFTLDGEEELHKIHRAFLAKTAVTMDHDEDDTTGSTATVPQIILRLLVPDEHSTVPLGEKFGAPPDRIPSLVKLALTLELPIIGVSFHCGSGCHDPTAYAQAIQLAHNAMTIIDQLQGAARLPPCWLLDIGGGFPGRDGCKFEEPFMKMPALQRFTGAGTTSSLDDDDQQDDKETAKNIAHAINPLLEELFPAATTNVQIISEPGRYFVEAAFALCSRIYRVQKEGDIMHYTIAQGVQGVFKDVVLCGESFRPIPLQRMLPNTTTTTTIDDNNDDDHPKAVAVFSSTIHGPSGEDYDIVCPSIELPLLQVGDWLLFDRMGAYTLSISARSGRPPIRYVMGGTATAGTLMPSTV